MSRLRLRDLQAPIDYADISRTYQVVRAVGGALIAAVGVLGVVWEVEAWPFFVVPGLATILHAGYRLRRAGTSAMTSLLVDVTMIGTILLAVAPMPAAEFAAIAYVVVAAMLLLALPEAAGVLAYGSTWGVLILAAAPIAEIAPDSAYRAGIGRIAGVVFLILIATFLFAASRVIHLVRRSQQEALAVERRAVKMKDEFVSMVSHEFRTPLTSIAGFVETLKDGWQYLDPAEVDEFLDIIHSEAHHLSNLVEDVLAIPRLEAGRMPIEIEDFELAATVRQVTDRVLPPGGTKDASVAIRGGIVVRADRRRVVQVLRNLLENARKYGGDQVLIEGRPDGEMYLVSISDNGPGVPPDSVERIFDRFEQVSTGDARSDMGIGLGLPIARHLVAAMGGQLWYEPRFPIGSRFCFTLPLVTVAERAVESPESTPAEVA